MDTFIFGIYGELFTQHRGNLDWNVKKGLVPPLFLEQYRGNGTDFNQIDSRKGKYIITNKHIILLRNV